MKSILLVDDEAAICVELQRTLHELEYQVEVAHTIESALESINATRFDMVLVEFNVRSECGTYPRTAGGFRLIRGIRKSGTTVPILVYTVMEGDTYRTASFNAGSDDFISKQIPISDLFWRFREQYESRPSKIR
jgi:DNA-binding response OmpR family regulator